MCVESKTIGMQLHALAVLDTACREYFWYGEDVFQRKRCLFQSWIEELGLTKYVERDLPTWNQLKDEFVANSKLRITGSSLPETKMGIEEISSSDIVV